MGLFVIGLITKGEHFKKQKKPSRKKKRPGETKKPPRKAVLVSVSLGYLNMAGAEGLEPSARGFGDRCSTN